MATKKFLLKASASHPVIPSEIESVRGRGTRTERVEERARPQDPISTLWPRAMCVETAARYLDCTPWHVEELCRSGTIVAFKEGKRWAVDRFELDRYVARRHSEAAALLSDFVKNAAANEDAA